MGKTRRHSPQKKADGGENAGDPSRLSQDAEEPFHAKPTKNEGRARHPTRPNVKASAKSQGNGMGKMGGDKLLLARRAEANEDDGRP